MIVTANIITSIRHIEFWTPGGRRFRGEIASYFDQAAELSDHYAEQGLICCSLEMERMCGELVGMVQAAHTVEYAITDTEFQKLITVQEAKFWAVVAMAKAHARSHENASADLHDLRDVIRSRSAGSVKTEDLPN